MTLVILDIKDTPPSCATSSKPTSQLHLNDPSSRCSHDPYHRVRPSSHRKPCPFLLRPRYPNSVHNEVNDNRINMSSKLVTLTEREGREPCAGQTGVHTGNEGQHHLARFHVKIYSCFNARVTCFVFSMFFL